MKSPERSLAELWSSLERDYWTQLCEQAPNPRYAQLYAIQLGLVGIPLEKRKNLHGQYVLPGVKGVTLACPVCLKTYPNCAPDIDENPCYCPCSHPFPKLLPPDQIAKVMDMTLRWFLKSGKFSS